MKGCKLNNEQRNMEFPAGRQAGNKNAEGTLSSRASFLMSIMKVQGTRYREFMTPSGSHVDNPML